MASPSDRLTRYGNEFGTVVSDTLTTVGLTQAELAAKLGKPVASTNRKITGRTPPPPEWINLIADALGIDDQKRTDLHRAAARDAGYQIGTKSSLDLGKA